MGGGREDVDGEDGWEARAGGGTVTQILDGVFVRVRWDGCEGGRSGGEAGGDVLERCDGLALVGVSLGELEAIKRGEDAQTREGV